MRYKLNGVFISIDSPFTTSEGVRYANLQNKEVRDSLGVIEVPDANRKDERFYWNVENEDGSITSTPKDMEDGEPYIDLLGVERRPLGLRSLWIAHVKTVAGQLLSKTDWKVVRAAEGIKPADQDTLDQRAAIRAYSDSVETAILGCTSVEQLIDIVNNQAWPK